MIRNTGCCGIKEIDGLRNLPIENLEQVVHWRIELLFCSVLFTDNDASNKGRDLAEFIKQNNLGDIVETKPVLNPNSDNIITAWIWTFDEDRMFELVNKENGTDYQPEKSEFNIF